MTARTDFIFTLQNVIFVNMQHTCAEYIILITSGAIPIKHLIKRHKFLLAVFYFCFYFFETRGLTFKYIIQFDLHSFFRIFFSLKTFRHLFKVIGQICVIIIQAVNLRNKAVINQLMLFCADTYW